MKTHTLLACKGCGSTMVEAFFTLAGIPYEREEVNYEKPGPERDRLLAVNPLGEIPTLILPTGEILTESLAIARYVDHLKPEINLIPKKFEHMLKFERWATFLIAGIYPTFTYGDTPEKWIPKEVGTLLRSSTDEARKKYWGMLEKEAKAPYFLGETFSAIDIYLGVMVHWRPRAEWFQEHCPKVMAIGKRIGEKAELKDVWEKNFH